MENQNSIDSYNLQMAPYFDWLNELDRQCGWSKY
jgi:hypothetical protein